MHNNHSAAECILVAIYEQHGWDELVMQECVEDWSTRSSSHSTPASKKPTTAADITKALDMDNDCGPGARTTCTPRLLQSHITPSMMQIPRPGFPSGKGVRSDSDTGSHRLQMTKTALVTKTLAGEQRVLKRDREKTEITDGNHTENLLHWKNPLHTLSRSRGVHRLILWINELHKCPSEELLPTPYHPCCPTHDTDP